MNICQFNNVEQIKRRRNCLHFASSLFRFVKWFVSWGKLPPKTTQRNSGQHFSWIFSPTGYLQNKYSTSVQKLFNISSLLVVSSKKGNFLSSSLCRCGMRFFKGHWPRRSLPCMVKRIIILATNCFIFDGRIVILPTNRSDIWGENSHFVISLREKLFCKQLFFFVFICWLFQKLNGSLKWP